MRVAAGNHHCGRRTASIAIAGCRGGADVVVEIDVERRECQEIRVLAASKWRNIGLAQRLADVDVLTGPTILRDGAFDKIVELVGPEDCGVAQPSVAAV